MSSDTRLLENACSFMWLFMLTFSTTSAICIFASYWSIHTVLIIIAFMGKLYTAGEMATKLLNNIMTTNKNSFLMAFIPSVKKHHFFHFQFLKTIYDGSLAVEMFYVNVLYVSKKNKLGSLYSSVISYTTKRGLKAPGDFCKRLTF